MRINAINPVYVTNVMKSKVKEVPEVEKSQKYSGISVINFKGGNKEQALMIGVEVPPYNKSGGVATVMQDFRALRINDTDPTVTNAMKNSFDFYKQSNKVLVDPIYNGFKTYRDDGITKTVEVPRIPTGLPDNSPFKKYEGRYFQTTSDQFQKYETIEDFFKNEKNLQVANIKNEGVKGNIFILDPIGETQPLDFGGLEDSETRLFRVQLEVDGKLRNTNDFKVFTDLTASLESPYAQGGYSTVPGKVNQTWKSVPDAKAMKAIVDFMPTICDEVSKDGIKFDPATIILNDSQTGYATEYIAEKAVLGDEFWKGKKAVFIGHNLGDGYVQRTSFMNMFMSVADKELRNAVYNCEEFTAAAKEGEDAVKKFFKSRLPEEFFDKQSEVSPFKNTVYWAQKGLVSKIIPVSELYAQVLASDPEFAPSVYKYLKELSEQGVFEGNLNAFENVEFDPTTNQGPGGYFKKTHNFEVNGKNVKFEPLTLFDAEKIKEGAVDTNYVRKIKGENKFKILQRFDADVLKALNQYKDVKGKETLFSDVILGLGNKEAEVHGYISKDIIEEAKKPNTKVRMIAGWGRIDAQKAMDTAMLSFIDYIKSNPEDKYSVMFIGGPNNNESARCIDILSRYSNDKDVAGRLVFIDGFLPNKPFASAADFTVFPSRFAPCELTDLESVKMFASPIVTNLQGLEQKNFDSTFEGEADKVTGYKTRHAYTIHLEDMKKLLDEEDNKALDKAVKKFRDEIKKGVRNKEVTEEYINEKILYDAGLNWKYNFGILRPFRDKIVQRELTGLYKRALIDDYGKPAHDKILQNLRTLKTGWEDNNALKPDGIASAEKYRKAFRTDPKTIQKEDTLLFKLREKCKDILEEYRNKLSADKNKENKSENKPETKTELKPENKPNDKTLWQKFKGWSKTKKGKWTLGIAGGTAVAASIGYAGYKSGWLSPKFADEKEHGHLSQIA